MEILVIQVLNSIFYAAVLFLIAAGLALFPLAILHQRPDFAADGIALGIKLI